MRRALLALALVACGHAMHKRALPDYDGRAHQTSVSESLLWIPRVVVSPLYFTAEYLIRRPMGWLIRTAEADHWPTRVLDFFTNDNGNVGVVPIAFYETGFSPSLGVYLFWNHMFAAENQLRGHASVGFGMVTGAIADRYTLGRGMTFIGSANYTTRNDFTFWGLGPRSEDDAESRFSGERAEGAISVVQRLRWGASVLRFDGGIRAWSFGTDTCCKEPTVVASVRNGLFSLPPGFRTGYTDLYGRLELTLDSRPPRPGPRTGVRGLVYFDANNDLQGDLGSWLGYGATAELFWDVWNRRVLELLVDAQFTDGLQGGQVPFTEMPTYGGWWGPMQGLRSGRVVGRSAASVTLQYEWPVWVWLDGTAHIGLGNTFDGHLEDFSPALMRLSSGIGLRTSGSNDNQLEILFGFGTSPIDEGLRWAGFHLFFGATRGF